MATENDYKQTVYYLTKLLNGGLLGEKSCTPIRTAIEACELQIPKHPISKSWSPNLWPGIAMRILAETATTATTRTRITSSCPVCGQKLDYSE